MIYIIVNYHKKATMNKKQKYEHSIYKKKTMIQLGPFKNSSTAQFEEKLTLCKQVCISIT